MILETFLAANSAIMASRTINAKIKENMKNKIISEGLYHVTSEEAAQKIMESGYIKPSNNIASYGRKKCFFFAGTPNYENLISNVQGEQQFEFKAIKIMPNEEELSKFKQRIWNDDAITYKGRCDLPEERVKKVDLVLDIDEAGKIFTREKTEEELENGYVPNQHLKEQIEKQNKAISSAKSYVTEYKSVWNKAKRNFMEFKEKLFNKSNKRLPEVTQNISVKDQNEVNMMNQNLFEESLKENTYSDSAVQYENEKQTEEIKKDEQQFELE